MEEVNIHMQMEIYIVEIFKTIKKMIKIVR